MAGPSAEDELAKDCAFFGIEPPQTTATPEALWEVHIAPLNAFLSVSSQWRTAPIGNGFLLAGLDYTAVEAGFRLAGIELSAPQWADFQVIERAAKAALNGD